MRLRSRRRGERHIESVILIDAAGAGLYIERGKARMVFVVVVHAADMEGVAGILAVEVGSSVGVSGKGEIESARREPARCARRRVWKFAFYERSGFYLHGANCPRDQPRLKTHCILICNACMHGGGVVGMDPR
jgi:hypothetical protein